MNFELRIHTDVVGPVSRPGAPWTLPRARSAASGDAAYIAFMSIHGQEIKHHEV